VYPHDPRHRSPTQPSPGKPGREKRIKDPVLRPVRPAPVVPNLNETWGVPFVRHRYSGPQPNCALSFGASGAFNAFAGVQIHHYLPNLPVVGFHCGQIASEFTERVILLAAQERTIGNICWIRYVKLNRSTQI
jgi:hypothetical protein